MPVTVSVVRETVPNERRLALTPGDRPLTMICRTEDG